VLPEHRHLERPQGVPARGRRGRGERGDERTRAPRSLRPTPSCSSR
jgi:hypothetical protein